MVNPDTTKQRLLKSRNERVCDSLANTQQDNIRVPFGYAVNYHMIRTDDMLNGDGLRVVLFLSGCEHQCNGCHNPETWDVGSGKPLTISVLKKIYQELDKDYISGITLSGGDPFHPANRAFVLYLLKDIRKKFPTKTIWIYTGYKYDFLVDDGWCQAILSCADVLVDGRFISDLASVNYPWAGSTNQRVIDVKKSLSQNTVILYS